MSNTTSLSSNAVPPDDLFSDLYACLGRRCGPESAPEAREITFQSLATHGSDAAKWLVMRASSEHNIEVILDVIYVLQLIGETKPVMDALTKESMTAEARRGLWMALESLPTNDKQSILLLAERDLTINDSDLRATIEDVLAQFQQSEPSLH